MESYISIRKNRIVDWEQPNLFHDKNAFQSKVHPHFANSQTLTISP